MTDAINVDAFGVLELIGLDDESCDKVVDYLIEEHLIRKDPGGYNVTSKGQHVVNLYKYINEKDIINCGEVSIGKKARFDWLNRWFAHPLFVSLASAIIGALAGILMTHYFIKW